MCILVLTLALAPMLAHAQAVPAVAWTKSPSIVVVGAADDPRIGLVRDAVDFWNGVFAELGSGFRLGSISTVAGAIPDDDIFVLIGRGVSLRSFGDMPKSVRAAPGDIVVALSQANFVSFSARWPHEQRALVAIKSHRVSPLTLPNVLRNVIAHEFGHAIGLRHNADPTMLMCGRPAGCRPDAFTSDTERYFPLTGSETDALQRLYPPDWKAAAADGLCATLADRVDEVPGNGPMFLRSFDHADGVGPAAEPALNGAFSYDNALAAIALVACGTPAHAGRIGDAFLAAIEADRAGPHGRLRNAYRAGALRERPVPPMGWWSSGENMWIEDPYQVGTASGNVAWAALALLTLADATGETRFRAGAVRLAHWAAAHAKDDTGPGGFIGGVFGDGARTRRLGWKSTEHNVDLIAVFAWLARTGDTEWRAHQAHARAFVDRMWDAERGRFWTGTAPDGVSTHRDLSGLDAQLWPQLLSDAPPAWRRAVDYAERAHGVPGDHGGGFDFNDDRDGLWVEGTAQAALVYRALGQDAEADRLLREIAGHTSPGGYLWATRERLLTTGLAIAPDSTTDDFLYYRRPHLAATAWAVLARTRWNPFTGARVP